MRPSPGPRWHKVWRDVWARRTRTALVVLSIAIGVFAIGVTSGTRQVVARDLAAAYASVNPSSATIQTLGPFDSSVVEAVRDMRGVRDAEGRLSLGVRMKVPGRDWRNVQLIALPDDGHTRIDRVRPDTGRWPAPEHGILIERSGLALTGATVGQDVLVKVPGERERQLTVAGTAHDMYALLYTLDGVPYVFVSEQTYRWLGGRPGVTELRLVADEPQDRQSVERLANAARDRVERAGQPVMLISMPEPGKHPLDSTIQAILLLLGAFGVLSLLLGALLVTNTVSALLSEEVRYVGVMKAVGAQRPQLAAMYSATVLLFGLLALLPALPLSAIGARLFADLLAGLLNFDLGPFRMPASVLTAQVAVGLAVPLIAAAYPIAAGTRITVREAISQYGLGKGRFGRSRVDRLLERVRGLPRPTLLSLRNTFRRKGRLALTVTTLAVGTMIILTVLNVRSAALSTLDAILQLWQYDLFVQLSEPRRGDILVDESLRVGGVVRAEPWGWASAHWPDSDEANASVYAGYVMPVMVFAPPPDTTMLKPTLLAGRWLLGADQNAIVVNTKILSERPGLGIGDPLTLTIGARDTRWTVVGVVRDIGLVPIAYVPYEYYTRVVGETGRASVLAVVTDRHDEASQTATSRAVESQLGHAGLPIALISKASEERGEAIQLFNFILVLLLVMACLVAVVGGLGLMGAMSLNVIERTREIGVMRAIGATDSALMGIFVVEGLIVGWLSWAVGLLAAVPISRLVSDAVGRALLDTPLGFTFDARGSALWLAIVTVVSIAASLVPALRAAGVSVREALAYE